MATIHHLPVVKTARYLSAGGLSSNTEIVWIALHGYGQNIHSYAKNFDALTTHSADFVLMPEGLNRFYWEGFGGKPVAGWMTSEDRENEINDYLNYLEKLYALWDENPDFKLAKKVLLGFSQGTATATRMMAKKSCHFDSLILWAGPFAHDINWEDEGKPFFSSKNFIVIGSDDPFIQPDDVAKQEQFMSHTGVPYHMHKFNGKHELNHDVLMDIRNKILSK